MVLMHVVRSVLADGSIPRTAVLWLVGSGALALGVLVYLTDRSASHAPVLLHIGLQAPHRWFGAVGGWLPSFVHALAFSLFSAALLAPLPRWEIGACGFWFAVNAAFEIGQHPRVHGPLADALRHGLGQGPVARAFGNYFLRGTFDVGDLVAAALGAALAASILHCVRVQRENHRAT
jgi:hypothetical protein